MAKKRRVYRKVVAGKAWFAHDLSHRQENQWPLHGACGNEYFLDKALQRGNAHLDESRSPDGNFEHKDLDLIRSEPEFIELLTEID